MQSLHTNEKHEYRIRYLIVPDFVFNNRKLSRLSVELYSFIHGYRGHEFFFSNEKLAELFNCDIRSLQRAISQLKEEGYIECEQPNGKKRFITDLWDDRYVTPGVTDVSPHVEADGMTDVSPENLLNQEENEANSEDFSVSNKNIFNKNNLANFKKEENQDIEKYLPSNKKPLKPKQTFGSQPTFKSSSPSKFVPFPERTAAHGEHII